MKDAQHRLAALMVAGIATIVGCTGDNDGDAPTTTELLPRTTRLTVSATTTAPSVPTMTSTTTTVVPTTTVDQIALTKQAVADAAVASREAYLYAIYNLDATDVLSRLEATSAAGSESLAQGLSNVQSLRENGFRARPNPDVPSNLTVESDVELLDGPPATKAEVTACVVSAGVVYEPGSAPDGSDTIVNDEIVARRTRISLVLEDGAWKVSSGVALGEWNGTATCPDA